MKKKNTVFKLVIALVILAAAIVWLLSVVMPDQFKNVKLSWVLAAAFAVVALAFFFKAIVQKNLTFIKKLDIFVGCGFLIAAVLALIDQFVVIKNAILPIIAVVIAFGVVLSVLIVGGKSFDTADNEKVGYKTYRERKAEEEANKKLDQLNNEDKQ